MKIFVTGGSGFVGKCFIRYVLQHHPEYSPIIALSRSVTSDEIIMSAAENDSSQVKIARGDLTNIAVLEKHLEGCTAVFHVAAKVDIWGQWEDFVQANIVGTKNLLSAAKSSGVKRFVHVSTEATVVNGFNESHLSHIDESTPLCLDPPIYLPYSQSKALTEKAVLEANESNFTTVVVKPRLVWGKGDTKVFPMIEKAIRDGVFKWFTPEAKTSTCHVENLCEGMILAAVKGEGGHAYFVVDGEGPILFNDFVRQMLAGAVDLDSVGSVNSSLVWYLATFLENIPFLGYGVTREPPINRQALALLAQDVIIHDGKARKILGYSSHKSREQGIQEYLDWRKSLRA